MKGLYLNQEKIKAKREKTRKARNPDSGDAFSTFKAI
jgi:hypothetical protein